MKKTNPRGLRGLLSVVTGEAGKVYGTELGKGDHMNGEAAEVCCKDKMDCENVETIARLGARGGASGEGLPRN